MNEQMILYYYMLLPCHKQNNEENNYLIKKKTCIKLKCMELVQMMRCLSIPIVRKIDLLIKISNCTAHAQCWIEAETRSSKSNLKKLNQKLKRTQERSLEYEAWQELTKS